MVDRTTHVRKHGLDFARVGELLASPYLDEPDDRPPGYEQEGATSRRAG
jgi:hypothetical protein